MVGLYRGFPAPLGLTRLKGSCVTPLEKSIRDWIASRHLLQYSQGPGASLSLTLGMSLNALPHSRQYEERFLSLMVTWFRPPYRERHNTRSNCEGQGEESGTGSTATA